MFLFVVALASFTSALVTPRDSATDAKWMGGTGKATWYNVSVGYTACGKTFKDTGHVVALSEKFFTGYPGATANPNLNPTCGKQIKFTYKGKSVVATSSDRCPGCTSSIYDIDLTPSAFSQLADLGDGFIEGVKWEFVKDVKSTPKKTSKP